MFGAKMKQHKWHKEIKAWADGAEIEGRVVNNKAGLCTEWANCSTPNWNDGDCEYRIKPQPKPVQYLYVYKMHDGVEAGFTLNEIQETSFAKYIGKIKLEVDDE